MITNYIILGVGETEDDELVQINTTPLMKVQAIQNPKTMRLFLWKLHNAVNSSISRQEQWFHRNTKALYTNRYWPSLETELNRAGTRGERPARSNHRSRAVRRSVWRWRRR